MSETAIKTRLYVSAPLTEQTPLLLEGDQAHFLSRVLRLQSGDAVALFNGRDGLWRATVQELRKKQVDLRIESQLKPQTTVPDCRVCFAPIKFGKIDYLAQKMTELGAAALQPVLTQYTNVNRVNTERLHSNAIEAAEQCERLSIPDVHEPVSLPELLAAWPKDLPLVFADESGACPPVRDQLNTAPVPNGWGILIGPEGGFAPEEGELIRAQPYTIGIGLGPRILRADTAALSLLAITQTYWGDWHQAPHFMP